VTALRFDRVTLRYGASDTAPALAEVSLEIEGGRIAWLFGSLGAGCSSLLLAAAGLAPRHTGGILTGAVTALGADPHDAAGRLALAGRIGYVTATPGVQLSGVAATVWEEVAFAPANLGWPIERIRTAVSAALDRVAIGHLSARDPAALSGGELQRVVIAAMLALSPGLWLLDEPASALDRAGRAALTGVLRSEAERGAAVVIASEDADTMAALADRLIVLDQGRLALDGAPRDILAGDALWRYAGGSTSIANLARSAAALLEVVPGSLRPPYPLTVEEGLARWT
jgi:energy-coupling factor transporter ATP-binding protein EcfA2